MLNEGQRVNLFTILFFFIISSVFLYCSFIWFITEYRGNKNNLFKQSQILQIKKEEFSSKPESSKITDEYIEQSFGFIDNRIFVKASNETKRELILQSMDRKIKNYAQPSFFEVIPRISSLVMAFFGIICSTLLSRLTNYAVDKFYFFFWR